LEKYRRRPLREARSTKGFRGFRPTVKKGVIMTDENKKKTTNWHYLGGASGTDSNLSVAICSNLWYLFVLQNGR
jgi:hypothetical protein